MKVIVSVQAKRGSSRGLVHYISHSKINQQHEPERGRELFNRFADSLSVESANNSLKTDTIRKRPGNDQLHHLVLSFRRENFSQLGHTDRERRKALKEITRAALRRLGEHLQADRLAWAAAVHLNTANPHIHFALQKTYFTHAFEEKRLNKIPREAVPHYSKAEGQNKSFVQGYLAEGAAQKMDEIIDRTLTRPEPRERPPRGHESKEQFNQKREQKSLTHERKVLRDWLLLKHEFRSSEERISLLLQHGHRLHFVVNDAGTGQRRPLSLQDIDELAEKRALTEAKKKGISNPLEIEILKRSEVKAEQSRNAPAIRQIHAILRNLVEKEETRRFALHNSFKRAERDANKVKAEYRKDDRKLPAPSLSKDELDRLQEHGLSTNDIRGFGFLERVREELLASGEIADRNERDIGRLSFLKTMFELRSAAHDKDLKESRANRYSRLVKIDGTDWSLQRLDKREKERAEHSKTFNGLASRVASFFFGDKHDDSSEREQVKDQILNTLDMEDRELINLRSKETKKQKLLEKILGAHGPEKPDSRSLFNINELKELDVLSSRVKSVEASKKSWQIMRHFIERSDITSAAAKRVGITSSAQSTEKALGEEKTRVLAGRALAKEIVSRIQLAEAKESLEHFAAVRRFHKFEIKDLTSGDREFLCLNDVEMHHGSFLNQALDYVLESKQQRQVRRSVQKEVDKQENFVKSEVASASDMIKATSNAASEYKEVHFFGFKNTTEHSPIFTASELSLIERRIHRSENRSEVKLLEKALSAGIENHVESLTNILKDFMPISDHVAPPHERTRDLAEQAKEPQRVADLSRESRSKVREQDREGMIR